MCLRVLQIICFGRVSSDLHVRLGDNALSRDLFPTDYHCLGDNENRPIKWLALEALSHNMYSTASDVVCPDFYQPCSVKKGHTLL